MNNEPDAFAARPCYTPRDNNVSRLSPSGLRGKIETANYRLPCRYRLTDASRSGADQYARRYHYDQCDATNADIDLYLWRQLSGLGKDASALSAGTTGRKPHVRL